MANYSSRKQAPEKHATEKQTKPKKHNQRIKALNEIKRLQNTTDLLIKIKPFLRLVREIAYSYNTEIRFQKAAIEALQESSEAFLVRLFELTSVLASLAGRTTILQKDIRLARSIFNEILPNFQ